jgi:hypothetical protein
MSGSKIVVACGAVSLVVLGVAVGAYGPEVADLIRGGLSTPDPVPRNVPPDAVSSRQQPWDERLGCRPIFVDVTDAAGITFRHTNGLTGRNEYLEIMGGGVAAFDYDNDGDLDLLFVDGNRIDGDPDPAATNHLYRNEGNWRFVDVTQKAGLVSHGYGQGCATGDYDGDGYIDLLVTHYGRSVLYRNQGDGTFKDVTSAAGIDHDGWGQSASFFDADGDGDLDLFLQNYLAKGSTKGAESFIYVGDQKVRDYPSPLGFAGSASRFYRNNGDGTFTDDTAAAGLDKPGKGMGIACVDFDGDRAPDIFVANDTMENFLFRNLGAGKFEEIAHLAGVAYDAAGTPEASMGVDAADYDNDGDLDLIVPCLARQSFTLYRNDQASFTEVSSTAGVAEATGRSTGFDAHFFDFDNDADLDLLFTCGGVRMNESATADSDYNARYGMPDLLLANDGSGHYSDVSREAGAYFQRALIGRGSAVADLDNDGDLDIVISNLNDRPVVLRNDTHGGHWLTLEFVDRLGRRNPNGVSVWITAGGRRQHAVSHPGTTYLSQSDRRMHFGLGKADAVEQIDIEWPDGTKQVLRGLPGNRFETLRQENVAGKVENRKSDN